MIAIIDYGVGNIFSLYSSFRHIGAEAKLTADPDEIRRSDKIVLPGVGAFGDAAELSFRDGVLQLSVSDNAGYGRTVRKVRTERIEFLRILVDTSVLEIYADDGKIVLTTRYYPDYQGERQDLAVHFHCPSAAITGWRIHPHCFF